MNKAFGKKKYNQRDKYGPDSQSGQTMIETLAAIFILVMGITAAVGLAVFAYSSSTNVTKQIIATGLAREGLEAVKNMRDTNWLKLTINRDCYNFASTPVGSIAPAAQICPGEISGGVCCYKNWVNNGGLWGNPNQPDKGYNFNLNAGGNPTTYTIYADFDAGHKTWNFTPAVSNFGLNIDSNTSGMSFSGFYVPNASGPDGSSDYYRKIIITPITAPPFNVADYGPKLRVVSQVWWTDKKCPRHPDWQDDGKCSVQLEMELTNWKNY